MRRTSPNALLTASIGTLIEYYDSALFSIFFPVMVPFFIPSHSVYEALTQGFWVLALTALARPLGALCFGHIGDKKGRRPALLLSLYGIALATLGIGIMPSYAVIGLAGVVGITLCKTLQIFCFAGEQNGSAVYVLEKLGKQGQAFTGSILSAMTWCGSLLAALMGVLLTADGMPRWSWRMAFIAGGLLALWGAWKRRHLQESLQIPLRGHAKYPLRDLWRLFPRQMMAGIWVGAFSTVPCTTVFIFINPVLMTEGFFTPQELMGIHSLLNGVAIAVVLLAGYGADRWGTYRIMQMAGLGLAIGAYPLLWLVQQRQGVGVLVGTAAIIALNEWGQGPAHAYLKSLFPIQYRYRACSLSFSTGMAFFGAITPIGVTYLFEYTGTFQGLALWLGGVGLGLFCAMRWAREHTLPAD